MIRKASLKDLKQIAELFHSEMSKPFTDVGEKPITEKADDAGDKTLSQDAKKSFCCHRLRH